MGLIEKTQLIKEEEQAYSESPEMYDSLAHKLGLFDQADIPNIEMVREEDDPFIHKLAINSSSPSLHRAL